MASSAKEKGRTGTTTKTHHAELVRAEVSRGAIRAMAISGFIVALWVVACLVGGMIVSGGPFALVKGWFAAITGM